MFSRVLFFSHLHYYYFCFIDAVIQVLLYMILAALTM